MSTTQKEWLVIVNIYNNVPLYTKYMTVEWKNSTKQNKIGQLTIKNYTFERDENTTVDKTLTYASETWILTKRDRQQINKFERKV
jgi:hypothetical protein